MIVRMIVIYTADVERSETSDLLDAGCLKLETQSVFLSEMNSEENFQAALPESCRQDSAQRRGAYGVYHFTADIQGEG